MRWGIAMAIAGLTLGAPARAQDSAPAAPANQSDSIGPRELQNFNLSGTVTRQSDQTAIPARRSSTGQRPAAAAPAPTSDTPSSNAARGPASSPVPTAAAPNPGDAAPSIAVATRSQPVATPSPTVTSRADPQAPQVSSLTVKLPPASGTEAAAGPGFTDQADGSPALPAGRPLTIWPWLLAALALGAGGAYLLWRKGQGAAFAGGPRLDAFVAPEPAPSPVPAPAPRKSLPAAPGLVSTRLRPWLDMVFQPLRCIVENEQVHFEFEVELVNSGSASARDVLIEASMINASPTQDEDLAKFFGNPVGLGERIPAIPPMKRVSLRPKLTVPLNQVRVLDAGGRKVFVPLIAFNALYDWGKGEGQTSAAYLVGRDTKGEKMSPFRLDLGPRVFRGVGACELPQTVRN